MSGLVDSLHLELRSSDFRRACGVARGPTLRRATPRCNVAVSVHSTLCGFADEQQNSHMKRLAAMSPVTRRRRARRDGPSLAWARPVTASRLPGVADGAMRRAERTVADRRRAGRRLLVDTRHVDRHLCHWVPSRPTTAHGVVLASIRDAPYPRVLLLIAATMPRSSWALPAMGARASS